MAITRKLAGSALALLLLPTAGADADACRDCAPRALLEVASVQAKAEDVLRVPVRLHDAPGTPLGPERGPGAGISGLAFRLRFAPSAAVREARVLPAREAGRAAPVFEAAPRTGDGISYLVVLAPGDAAGARPGAAETVAVLELTLEPRQARGQRIELRLDPLLTTLSNAAGTLTETVASGHLRLQDGVIEVD
ncbi:MAG: hypothetical protein IT479_02080 [Xanthomonadales bacterium]|nr:hypothetical protein [Xanthomonadales bacterium]MCC6592038.1 hypothetical protein [Xanthomonadales bacterium]MCE7931424.1 hypothetical protein [Xanthomonadales bacterium PRO6]